MAATVQDDRVRSAPVLPTFVKPDAVLPHPTLTAADSALRFEDVVRHQLSQLKVACLLAAAFAPVAVCMCAVYNHAVDEYAAAGENPHYPEHPNEVAAAAWPRAAVLFALSCLIALGGQGVAGLMALSRGARVPRREAAVLVALCLALSAVGTYPTLVGNPQRGWRQALFALGTAHAVFLGAWVARRAGGDRRLAAITFVIVYGIFLTLLSVVWFGARRFMHAEKDTSRLAVLVASTAVYVEPVMVAVRAACYTARDDGAVRRPVTAAAGHVAVTNVLFRWAITAMDTASGTAGAIAIVGVINAVVWHSVARRDLWLGRRVFGAGFSEPRARSVSATIRCVAEISDLFACIAMSLLVALFRVGPDKQAPAPGPILLSLAGQLFVCLGTDFAGALVALWLGPQSAVYRSYARGFELRVSALRERRTRYERLLALGLLFAATGYAVRGFYDPVAGDHALTCAWSKSEGSFGWHRVPCREYEEWEGL